MINLHIQISIDKLYIKLGSDKIHIKIGNDKLHIKLGSDKYSKVNINVFLMQRKQFKAR